MIKMSDQQTNLSGRDCPEKCTFSFCKLYETCQKNMDYECTIVHNFFTISPKCPKCNNVMKKSEIYVCDCGKIYKKKGCLINHCIQKKHTDFCPEQTRLFEKYPIDVKKAILNEYITFKEAETDVMFFVIENPEIDKKFTCEDLLEMRKEVIKNIKYSKERIKEIINYYKNKEEI